MTGEVVHLSDNTSEMFGYIKTDMGHHVLLGRNLQGCRKENMDKLILVEGSVVSFEDNEGMAKNIIVERSPDKVVLILKVVAAPLLTIGVLLAMILFVLSFRNLSAHIFSGILLLCILSLIRETFDRVRNLLS